MIEIYDKIKSALRQSKKPAILCSFGKDSVLMATMVLNVDPTVPIVFFRHSYNDPIKYRYADNMIQWFGTNYSAKTIQGLPPAKVELIEHKGDVDFIEHYLIGSKSMMVPVGIIPSEKGICSKEQIFEQIVGTYTWNFDLLFCGHKACDKDSLVESGSIPIKIDMLNILGNSSLFYPIKNISDADVFRMMEELMIPIDVNRYECVEGTWRERDDKTINGDWTEACINCMKPSGALSVTCPKTGFVINNLGRDVVSDNPLNNLSYIKE